MILIIVTNLIFYPHMTGMTVCVSILPRSRAIISAVEGGGGGEQQQFAKKKKKKKKKKIRMSLSKTGKPLSFSAIPISFHSVDSVRKMMQPKGKYERDHRIQAQ